MLTKTVFLHQLTHILINCAFLLFWNNFVEIHRELFFFYIKVTISEKSTEIVRKFVFLTMFERANPEENLDLFKQLFFWNHLNGININKNCFSPQSEPHTAKLCLSVVLKNFWGNSWRNFLFRHKSNYLRNEHWNTLKHFFVSMFERGKSRGKFWFI